jgi:hypothetical protein
LVVTGAMRIVLLGFPSKENEGRRSNIIEQHVFALLLFT